VRCGSLGNLDFFERRLSFPIPMLVDSSAVYYAGITYIICKWVLELLMTDMWNMIKRVSDLVFRIRVVRFDDYEMPYEEFIKVARWIGGDLWSDDPVRFLSGNHSQLTTPYRLPHGKGHIYGPIFDDGLRSSRNFYMFGFGLLCFGSRQPWVVRKWVDGWPVWISHDGIHSFLADEHKVLHQNSARFGNLRPAAVIITLSFCPQRVMVKLNHYLRLRPVQPPATPARPLGFRNYHALVRTEGKTAEVEWLLRKVSGLPPPESWPNPATHSILERAQGVLSSSERGGCSRLNILLFGTYGTGKTYLAQLLSSITTSHLVIVTKQSKWSAILDSIYNVARGPKVILFDEFDTMFAEDTIAHEGGGNTTIMQAGNAEEQRRGRGGGGGSASDRDEKRGDASSLLSQGGVMNFRKTCAGYVDEAEEDAVRDSIEKMPSQLLQEHHLLSLLDGSAFTSYGFPVVCLACTNFPDSIPERVTRWGRISYRLEMRPHTLESALVHVRRARRGKLETSDGSVESKVRALFEAGGDLGMLVTPAKLQSLMDTAFLGVDGL